MKAGRLSEHVKQIWPLTARWAPWLGAIEGSAE